MTEYLDRIAYVAEAHDAEEPGRLSGRFGVGWASEDGEEHSEGPEYLSAEEAITWAREHAPRVLVRIDADTHFTAGEARIHSVHVSTSEQQTEITCAFLARNVWIVTLEANRIISAALRAAVPELADKGDHQIGFSLETLWPTSRRDAPST